MSQENPQGLTLSDLMALNDRCPISPEDLLVACGGEIPRFTKILVQGRERTVYDLKADGIMLAGGTLIFWEEKVIEHVLSLGDGAKLKKPTSSPVVITARGINRRPDAPKSETWAWG